MRAVVFHEFGGFDKLKYEETETPKPSNNEALVRVRACALNHVDLWARTGLEPENVPLPHISGSDISGEVAAVGESVDTAKVGYKVIVAPGLSDWTCDFCIAGRDNMCRSYRIMGYQVNGGYAEYVKVPKENLIPMPTNATYEEAAAFPLVYLTAWHMLVSVAGIRPGQDVLVLAAGSGVGSAAIRIAKLFGARVITTVGSEWKERKAVEIGADKVINHKEQNIVSEVKNYTNARGVDVVVEHVGASTWDASIKSLAFGGRIVTCGATTGNLGQTDLRYLFRKQLSINGTYMGTKAELIEAVKLFGEGKLKPVIDSVFPLKNASEAQRKMEESKHFGKIVLTP